MVSENLILLSTAFTIGFLHTLTGPDHYLPFIAMSKARGWSRKKTTLITLLCGLGHVGGSVILGFIGIALGVAVFKLEAFESLRGELAAWLLIGFGFAYMVWGIHRALRKRPHSHSHIHSGGVEHTHRHAHTSEHAHPHENTNRNITPWILFTIFVFGPCEPLIPILMYPAAKGSLLLVFLVTAVFSLATVGTMLTMVLALSYGLHLKPMARWELWSHAAAGAVIFLSGAAIRFLGL